MTVSIALPRVMRVGANASRLLPDVLAQFGLSKPFVMSDRYLVDTGRAQPLMDVLGRAGMKARLFADTMPEPDVGFDRARRRGAARRSA